MPQIGPMEILVVAVVALLVFGPEKLPEMARNIGRTVSDLRRTAQEMRDEFSSGLEDDEEPPTRSTRTRRRPEAAEDRDDDSDYVVEDEGPEDGGPEDGGPEDEDLGPGPGGSETPRAEREKVPLEPGPEDPSDTADYDDED